MEQPDVGEFMLEHTDIDLTAVYDVLTERARQRFEFGRRDDDALLPAEWVARIAKHLGRAVSQEPETYRCQLVVIGALALAAVESYDRKRGESSGSH